MLKNKWLIEESLKDIKQDINNLWNNGGIVNEEIIVSIQDKLSILGGHKNQEYKIKNEIKELDEVHWKSFKEACLIAYNGKRSRNRDSNMIVNWRSGFSKRL